MLRKPVNYRKKPRDYAESLRRAIRDEYEKWQKTDLESLDVSDYETEVPAVNLEGESTSDIRYDSQTAEIKETEPPTTTVSQDTLETPDYDAQFTSTEPEQVEDIAISQEDTSISLETPEIEQSRVDLESLDSGFETSFSAGEASDEAFSVDISRYAEEAADLQIDFARTNALNDVNPIPTQPLGLPDLNDIYQEFTVP